MKEVGVDDEMAEKKRSHGYTDFSFIKDGMEFVSDIEADEYFDEINKILSQIGHPLNESKDD